MNEQELIDALKKLTPEQKQALMQKVEKDNVPPQPRKRGRPKKEEKDVVVEQSPTEGQRRQGKRSSIEFGKKHNRFFDIVDSRGNKIADSYKSDTRIDKKLQKGWSPTPRMARSNLIEVQCCICGKKLQVSSKMVMDRDRYKCDDCL